MKQITDASRKEALGKLNDLLMETDDGGAAVMILQAMDMLCDAHQMEMTEEAITVNIGLDDYFGRDVLTLR